MTTATTTARRVALAALLIAVGNIASRVLGLVREIVIAGGFARGAEVAAFTAASALPTAVYDLLINGAISAALVPVFSALAERDEDELWRVASTVFTLALLVTGGLVALLVWQADAAVTLLAGGFAPEIRATATTMVRWLLPSVVLMALSGLITALLYARQRFLLPAFTTSAYNIGIIIGAVALTAALGAYSLVAGVLLGAALQVLLQLPGLRGAKIRPRLELRDPEVRRILRLYAPVALGIGFSIIGIVLDRNLASRLGASAIPTMRYATQLIQLPLGLVAAAVSFAVLPTLARQADAKDEEAFRRTLAMGIKVVLLLIVPATAALAALAVPAVATIFQRGRFTAADTAPTAEALLLYLPGLPAAALDQMLLFAFYARSKTLAPNLVQGAAIGLYGVTALALLGAGLGLDALVIGNSVQWVGHALILWWLSRSLVNLRGLRIGETALKCGAAALALALVALGGAALTARFGPVAQLLVGGAAGAAAYVAVCAALRVEPLGFFVTAVRRGRARGG